ncbi:MAG: hypothetical protein HZB38_02320 [Planctomycetes bacterium]|nr:hypothetical protein [Planctomycetota bacterium]
MGSVAARTFGFAILAGVWASSAHADAVVEKVLRVEGGGVSIVLDHDLSIPLGLTAGSHDAEISPESTLLAFSANDAFVRTSSGAVRFGGFAVVGSTYEGDGPDYSLRTLDETQELLTLYGVNYDFDAAADRLRFEGRLQLSESFAKAIGQPDQAGAFVGYIRIDADLKLYSWTVYDVDGAETVLFPEDFSSGQSERGGPNVGIVDVIVGDLPSTEQFGRNGSQVGLGVGTTSCNKGTIPLNWFALPNTDHPVIPQNMYRLKNDRFEQIGQSWIKHAFTALQLNACGFGCTSGCSGTNLCGGCSDPYSASLNAGQTSIGSRAWVNAFTGVYPNTANSHTGHSHTGVSHRVIVEDAEINPAQNANAQWFVEGQYVTPHEFNHAASRAAGAMFNNVSYRRVIPSGAPGGTWTFGNSGSTFREQPAINAWTGSTRAVIEPAPGADGRAILAYKVTGPTNGLYHYEYVVYNMNLDRSVSAFVVPIGAGATISNVGFHAPRQHPAWANDGTVGSLGYSGAAWSSQVLSDRVEWRTDAFAQNQNANAIRWGTAYNFRFDSNRPPVSVDATVETFKVVGSATVATQGPQSVPNCPGDLNGDLVVDLGDLSTLLANFGTPSGGTPAQGDLDGDGDIDLQDLALLLAQFGNVC